MLYSALFGPTDICDIPTNEDTIRVIKSCPLSVPPFVNFKKWSRDVKRLEAHPLSVDISKVLMLIPNVLLECFIVSSVCVLMILMFKIYYGRVIFLILEVVGASV